MKLALDIVRGLAKVIIAICDLIQGIYDAWPTEPEPEPDPTPEPEDDDTDD